jgi:hypothetical protein
MRGTHFAQLIGVVQVAEALDHRDALGLPRLGAPAMDRTTASCLEVTATIDGRAVLSLIVLYLSLLHDFV